MGKKKLPPPTFPFPAMDNLAHSLDCTVNQLFCGYLRQPINVSYDPLLIRGGCTLIDSSCTYTHNRPVSEPSPTYTCPIYKKYFETHK